MKIFYTILAYLLVIIISYLIGSISFSKLISSHYGVDISKVGSGNAGGTNVGRNVSKKAGILTMFLDMMKCFIAALTTFLIFNYLITYMDIVKYNQFFEVICFVSALSCSIGHIYPIFSHFKGGKAVACLAGYTLFISPIMFLLGLIIFFTLFKVFRKVSICSILGSFFCFLLSLIPMILDFTVIKDKNIFNGGTYFAPSCMVHLTYITAISYFVFFIIIVIKHRSNIKRLINGEEPVTVFKK